MKIARKYRQIYVSQWYPVQFGRQDGPELEGDPHRHQAIVRQIIPTRTGLGNIKSTGVVWLWMVNGSNPIKENHDAVKKPWTKDDHWTHYPIGEKKSYVNAKEAL
jgi:hypothetical protein